jgi:predicted GNAT family acetyltransferase
MAWLEAFHAEADHDAPRMDLEAVVRDRVRRGLFMLWTDDGTTVSLAGFHEPSAGVARVGPVYTPPEHRRNGFAGGVTAAASGACLDRGATRCMLYTDLANPTSNGVYQRIGYTPVADAVQYAFQPSAG